MDRYHYVIQVNFFAIAFLITTTLCPSWAVAQQTDEFCYGISSSASGAREEFERNCEGQIRVDCGHYQGQIMCATVPIDESLSLETLDEDETAANDGESEDDTFTPSPEGGTNAPEGFCYGLDTSPSGARELFELNCPGQERVDCSGYEDQIICANMEIPYNLDLSGSDVGEVPNDGNNEETGDSEEDSTEQDQTSQPLGNAPDGFCYGLDSSSSVARELFEANCPGQERVDCAGYEDQVICANMTVPKDLDLSGEDNSTDNDVPEDEADVGGSGDSPSGNAPEGFCYGLDSSPSVARDLFDLNCPGQTRIDCGNYNGQVICANMSIPSDLVLPGDEAEATENEPDETCRFSPDPANTSVDLQESEYVEFFEAIETPAQSTTFVDENDLSVEEMGLPDGQVLRIVIRKPYNDGSVLQIDSVPEEPDAAREFLLEKFSEAASSSVSTLRFPAGSLIRLSSPGSNQPHLSVSGLADKIVDFNGSTLVFEDAERGFSISDMQRVVFKNGTLKTDILISSVARVETDNSPTGFKFTLLPEYVAPLEATFSRLGREVTARTFGKAELDNGTYSIDAEGYYELFTNRNNRINNYAYQKATNETAAHFKATTEGNDDHSALRVGDLLYALHFNNNGHAVYLNNVNDDVEDLTFENITFSNIAGMGIAGEIARGLHIDRLRVIPDENNSLAIWGSSSDAIHINNNGGDIIVENSSFNGSADDQFTAKGNWWRIVELNRENATLLVERAGDYGYAIEHWARAEDELVVIGPDFEVIAKVSSMNMSVAHTVNRHELSVDNMPTDVKVGHLIANLNNAGGRVLIRNNDFYHSRSQGALLQTQHMIVRDNVFSKIAGPAVKLNLSLQDWYEGVNGSNIAVLNNQFIDTGLDPTKPLLAVEINGENDHGELVEVIDSVLLLGNGDNQVRDDVTCQ